MSSEQVKQVREYGTKHLEFCMELYEEQMNNGLRFLHEHQDGATSWNKRGAEFVGD